MVLKWIVRILHRATSLPILQQLKRSRWNLDPESKRVHGKVRGGVGRGKVKTRLFPLEGGEGGVIAARMR